MAGAGIKLRIILRGEEMKPSDFTNLPTNSIIRKLEVEIVARNIMIILSRTGNIFRSLSWDEYRQERLRDDNFTEEEKKYFNEVAPWCLTGGKASLFSPIWRS